jgi:hypothetical protein
MEDSSYLMEKKIEYLIDMRVKKITSQIEEVGRKMQQMADDITVLGNKIQHLQNDMLTAPREIIHPQIQQETPKVMPQPVSAMPQMQVQQQSSQKNSPDYNQRVGNLKPGDVDISKMFYFGGNSGKR